MSSNVERAAAFEAKKESLANELHRRLWLIENVHYPVSTPNRFDVQGLVRIIKYHQKQLFNSISVASGDEQLMKSALKTFHNDCSAAIKYSGLAPSLLTQLMISMKELANKIGNFFGIKLYQNYNNGTFSSDLPSESRNIRTVKFFQKIVEEMEPTVTRSLEHGVTRV